MKKIAIYGGSFNPPTKGHMEVIKAVLPHVDAVWVVPIDTHPLNKKVVQFTHRYTMLKHLIEPDKQLEQVHVWDFQNRLGVPQKTFLFMRWLRKYWIKLTGKDENDYYIVIGSDNAQEIRKWYKWKQLCKENKFIIVKRGNFTMEFDSKLFEGSTMCFNHKCEKGYSSSEIRGFIAEQTKYSNDLVKRWLPKSVMTYIDMHKLYNYTER
jgi:nicotinate-nucleotide adenylyltransferase